MKNLKMLFLIIALSFGFNSINITPAYSAVQAPAKTQTAAPAAASAYTSVKPLEVVANPAKYLNKKIKIRATFDMFSSLGLDYKPAYKSSEDYITFLITRDDAANNIPLSEMKNFMKRSMAEKFIDVETGDIIEYSGTVFSNALGDVWIDVEKFDIITKKNKDSKKN